MTVYRALAIPFLVGIALFFALLSHPHFRDKAGWPWANDLDTDAFLSARESNRTVEGQLSDFGLGLATLALSLAGAAAALGARDRAGIRRLSTPSRAWGIVVLANVGLLAFFFGEFVTLGRDQARGEFAPWADSIGIPIALLVSGWQHLAPILTLALLICLWSARLPVGLWRPPSGWWPWIITLVIGLVVGVEIVLLGDAVWYGNAFVIPGHMTLIFSLLCGRAAAASRAAVPG